MRPRGNENENCLSRELELRLRKADRASGRQEDRRLVEDGLDEYYEGLEELPEAA